MKLDGLRKELQVLVATIESRDSDMERLHALERVFQLCNLCSTRSELRAFHDTIPQKEIPRLAKLAVARSGKGHKSGEVVLSAGAEHLMGEIATWAKSYDPGPDLAAAAIRRGDEKEIQPVVSAIIVELNCETQETRAWLASRLKSRGKKRVEALADVVVRQKGSKTAQRYAQALLGAVLCAECNQDQKAVRCGCSCRRYLCRRCSEVDGMTEMILRELAQSTS